MLEGIWACWIQQWQAAVSGSDRGSCQEICYEEEQLMFFHNLYIHSQNQRKVWLEEIVYCRRSQHLICLVELLEVVVASLYPR